MALRSPLRLFASPSPISLTNVTLLAAAGPVGHSLRVKGRRIAAIDQPPHKNDLVIDGGGGLLIPGLINAHDHLELNTFKRLKYREQYTHSVQWIEDIEARFETDPDLLEPRRQPLGDRLTVGALKNLLSGVTTVCHHNPYYRQFRSGYPIRVVSNYGFCHSLFRGDDVRASYQKTKPDQPWIIHLAEGVDAAARAEFDRLDNLGAVGPNTIVVHGVGLTPAQQHALIERGNGLVWCPGSNLFMFGQTAAVQALAAAGKLALGSDSRLSGEFDLLAELRLAARLGQLSPQQMFQAVTTNPARMLGLTDGRGRIEVGGLADLVLLPPPNNDVSKPVSVDPTGAADDQGYSALVNLERAQIALVMVGGQPLAGSRRMQPLFETTGLKWAWARVDGVEKMLSLKLVQRLRAVPVREPGLEI